MLVENSLHATILRKYVISDEVSLEHALGALEERLGETLSDESRAPFLERMSHRNGITHEHADFIESYLYSEIMHGIPKHVIRFADYDEEERKKLPAALVSWIDVVSHRVVLLEGLIEKVARRNDWGKGYRLQTPSDPTFAGAAIFAATQEPNSSDYRYAQEYVRERDERYFRKLDTVAAAHPKPSINPRPKVTEKNIDDLYGDFG